MSKITFLCQLANEEQENDLPDEVSEEGVSMHGIISEDGSDDDSAAFTNCVDNLKKKPHENSSEDNDQMHLNEDASSVDNTDNQPKTQETVKIPLSKFTSTEPKKAEENNDSLRSVKNDTQIVDQEQHATLIAKKHPINPVSGSSLLAEIKADRQVTKNAITVANGKKFIIKYQQGSHQSVTYIYHCQSRCYFRLPRRIQNWEKSQHIYGNIQSIEKIRAE